MAGFDCSGGTGVGAAAFVVAGLAAAGYQNVFDVAVGAATCMEPIVVRQHEWSCEARLDDGAQRGCERVRVYVCKCAVADCVATSAAACKDLVAASGAPRVSVDELGREQQRRASAYSRARGVL